MSTRAENSLKILRFRSKRITMSNGPTNFNDLLSAYHDGELTAAEQQAAERLLRESADARAELEEYQTLSASLRSIPAGRAPDGFRAAVLSRISQSSHSDKQQASTPPARRRGRRSILVIGGGGLAAAACLIIAIQVRNDPDKAPLPNGLAQSDAAETDQELMVRRGRGVAAESLQPDAALQPDAQMLGESREIVGRSRESERERGGISGGIEGGMSGFAAADVSVGDVYSYFDHTEDGDVVVVEATVVDVRRALNQLQVLFVNNSIPTATVSLEDQDGPGEASSVTEPNSELAVYVESDSLLINNALTQLREELDRDEVGRDEAKPLSNSFVDFQVTGVLDAPSEVLDSKPTARVERLSRSLNKPVQGPATTFSRDGSPRRTNESRGDAARPQARYSVPADRSPAAAPPEPAAIPEIQFGVSPSESSDRFLNYQTVLNVSKRQLDEQLQVPKPAEPESGASENDFFFQERSEAQKALPLNLGVARQSTKTGNGLASPTQAPRRVRVLVVLQPRGENRSLNKAKLPAQAPVEAPAPRPAKS